MVIFHCYVSSPEGIYIISTDVLMESGVTCFAEEYVSSEDLKALPNLPVYNFRQPGVLRTSFQSTESKQTHRIHGAGIYANIGGLLMGSMLPYIAYMDPMGDDANV